MKKYEKPWLHHDSMIATHKGGEASRSVWCKKLVCGVAAPHSNKPPTRKSDKRLTSELKILMIRRIYT